MVIVADVPATDIKVVGSSPIVTPATALMPICAPILGLAATFGIMVIPDFFRFGSGKTLKTGKQRWMN